MLRQRIAAATILIALALSACAVPETASREETISVSGVVRSINKDTRRLTIQGEDRTVVYRVSEEVRNFDQIQVGDEVSLDYRESVAVAMADPNDPGEALTDSFGVRAAEGERPGAAGASMTTFVVELVSYDARSGVATIKLPDEQVTSIRVAEPMRRFASTRKPGDRILILIEEAVAVQVTPA